MESSLADTVELTAELTENMFQDLQRHYSLRFGKRTSLCKKEGAYTLAK